MDVCPVTWPLVSVVIAAYNAEPYIATTIQSILDQDYPNVEIIIVDDGSTDRTVERVLAFQQQFPVTLIRQSNSGGPSAPRNIGLQRARGECIFIFDADDQMLPGKLQRTVGAYLTAQRRGRTIGLYCTNFCRMTKDGTLESRPFLDSYPEFRALQKQPLDNFSYLVAGEEAYRALAYENYIGTSSVMLPRFVVEEGLQFDTGLIISEDLDMWFTLLSKYDLAYVDIIGHGYRDHPENITSRRTPDIPLCRIVALERQLAKDLPKDTRSALLKRLRLNFYAMGYTYEELKDYRAARKVYLRGLRRFRHRDFVRALLASFAKELIRK